MTAVLVARCESYREDADEPCTGELRFRWGMSQSDPCSVCRGRCGIAVAALGASRERIGRGGPPMTPSPPPETAPETTDELREITRLLADLYVETCSVAGRTEGQVQCDAQEVRDEVARIHSRLTSVLDEVADPVESTEYRVVGTGPSGFQHVSRFNLRVDYDDWSERPDWTDVRYESRNRTVRTWTSGWSPVPDHTGETQ